MLVLLLDAVMMLVLLRLFAQVAGSTAHCVRPRVQIAMDYNSTIEFYWAPLLNQVLMMRCGLCCFLEVI